MYYNRYIEKTVLKSLTANPVTAILGPRQCGKSTLTKGTWQGIEDIKPEKTLIFSPVKDSWSMKEKVEVTSIPGAIMRITETFFI